MSTSYERVLEHLQELKLNRKSVILDGYLERAAKEKIPLVESLDFLLKEEISYKNDTSLKTRTKVAGFPYQKTFEQFDFKFQPSIDSTTINIKGDSYRIKDRKTQLSGQSKKQTIV